MFENEEVGPDALPEVDAVDWQAMDARFLRRQLTGAAIAVLIVFGGIAALQVILGLALADEEHDLSLGYLWVLPILVAIPLVVWQVVSVPRMGFAVRERDIVFRSGVFWRSVTAIPFNRIQHVEKSSTPLDRRFDLAALQLFTAGGTGGDLRIRGLSAPLAEKLRGFILDKVGTSVEQH